MKELFQTLRLAFYVCALPLVITAAASAHTWMMAGQQDEFAALGEEIQAFELPAAEEYNSMRQHVLCLDKEGKLNGRITAIGDDANVSPGPMTVYISQAGKVIATTQSEANGEFSISDLPPGQYTYVASGESKFVAFGINVKPCDDSGEGTTLVSSAVASMPFRIRRLMKTRFPFEIGSPSTITNTSKNVSADVSSVKEVSSIELRPDGSLEGIVRPFFGNTTVEGTQVSILRNDEVIAETILGLGGRYSFPAVEQGVYDLVANGPHGFAAVSFKAVGFVGTETAIDSEPIRGPNARLPKAAPQGDVVLTEPAGNETIIIVEQPMPEITDQIFDGGADGAYGDYYGDGGGGGYGDMGGLYGLGALAIVGWIISEVARNDNFTNQNPIAPPLPPVPISPFL